MKKLLSLASAIILLFLTSCGELMDWQYSGTDRYESDRVNVLHASEFMPAVAELKGMIDMKYTFRHVSTGGTGFSEGMALFVKYNTDTFSEGKAAVDEKYEELSEDDVSHPSLPFAEFRFRGYDMQIVPLASGDGSAQYFGILGFNYDKNKICFLFYSNDRADFSEYDADPGEMYTELIKDSFVWS